MRDCTLAVTEVVLTEKRMGWGDDLVHMQPGSRHSKHRSLVKDRFSPRGLEAFRALQRKEVYITLLHLGRTPDDFQKHLKRQVCFDSVHHH